MTPFEAVYRREYRLLMGWLEVGDVKPLRVDLLKDAKDKVMNI